MDLRQLLSMEAAPNQPLLSLKGRPASAKASLLHTGHRSTDEHYSVDSVCVWTVPPYQWIKYVPRCSSDVRRYPSRDQKSNRIRSTTALAGSLSWMDFAPRTSETQLCSVILQQAHDRVSVS